MRAYVHVPFCRQKCGYCKFALTPFVREVEVERYFTALRSEISAFLDTESENVGSLETLYFGGGTPSAVGFSRLAGITQLFRDRIGMADDVEITVEANPEDLSAEFCQGILAAGANRLSVGVQSIDDAVLATVGRASSDVTFKGLENAFSAGFRNVGCDLIAGLPGELPLGTATAVRRLTADFPLAHVSVYLLEEGKYPASWKGSFASVETVREDFLAARAALFDCGFLHYEISNFAKPGFESKHNRGYWDRLDTRGFGLSAASLWKRERFENASSFAAYYRGETVARETLTSEQIRLEEALCGIRTFGLSENLVTDRSALDRFVAQ
jgi:oxygen-independent coproporphyrinogen-3 oxidase